MSIDSVFVHKMWDDNELSKMVDGGAPFPMLSDTGGKVGKIFGVFNEEAGVENRGRFIIDPDGVPLRRHPLFLPAWGSNFSEQCLSAGFLAVSFDCEFIEQGILLAQLDNFGL